MSTGNFGIKRGADITTNDVEIFLHYTPSRTNLGNIILSKLDPVSVLQPVNNPNNTSGTFETFGGLYTLKLDSTTFANKGVYTIIIKPKEIRTTIQDCGVLSAFPDIRGLVFDTAALDPVDLSNFQNNKLIGYRIEYINPFPSSTERKENNKFTIITSNNKAESTINNVNGTNQKAKGYVFNDNSSHVFCTVTPSSSPSVTPNALIDIGSPGTEVVITNTNFDPLMVEIEMVNYTTEELAIGMFSNQSKSIDDGIFTQYDFDGNIYKQWNLYEIKDQFTGVPLVEVKEERTTIDTTKDFNNITNV